MSGQQIAAYILALVIGFLLGELFVAYYIFRKAVANMKQKQLNDTQMLEILENMDFIRSPKKPKL